MTTSVAFKAAKLLREARGYLTDKSHWVKGYFGLANGVPADYRLQAADRVCSLGAIGKAAGMNSWQHQELCDEAMMAENYLVAAIGNPVPNFNDAPKTTHEDVLAAFDLAIEEACKVVRKEVEEKPNEQ